MRKALWVPLVLFAVGGSGYAYYSYKKTGPAPTIATAVVTRGDIVDTVGATGTLQAVTTVQVGSQVSGTIQSLSADYNSLVRKGQVLARLDPSLFQTQIEQARANLIRAQADTDRLRVSLEDAHTKLARAKELSDRQLLPRSELDAADVAVRAAEAQLKSSEAQVTQAQASLNQNQVNLEHTVIEAPIDGLVISRSVDVGQTVAASMQAPTLFVLAADLTKMQVLANLDESDVGRIRPGQRVTFHVDAYPAEDFLGAVSQVRLEPKVQQNVVTYSTVIDVPNAQLKLKPGMTANVNIEIARSTNVLRIPNAALRFRPTNEIYAALGQTPPEQSRADFANAERTPRSQGSSTGAAANANAPTGSNTGSTASAQPAQPRGQTGTTGRALTGDRSPASGDTISDAQGRGNPRESGGRGNGADDSGRNRFADRLQNMSPEEREQALQRMRERGFDPASRGRGGRQQGAGNAPTPTAPAPPAPTEASGRGGATTIDALFGPLPRTESSGRIWRYLDKELKPLRVRLGISDGQATELLEGPVDEGAELVTNVTTGSEARPAAAQGGFPFMGQQRGGFPGGGFGGQGGGGNRPAGGNGGAGGRGR